jgi:predicted nucleic acid-binding Zn ribbon protein
MPPEEQDFDKVCLVCGKDVEHGEGFCRLKVEEYFIALCCPLCMEIYQKNPQRYLARLSIRNLRPPGAVDGGFDP